MTLRVLRDVSFLNYEMDKILDRVRIKFMINLNGKKLNYQKIKMKEKS